MNIKEVMVKQISELTELQNRTNKHFNNISNIRLAVIIIGICVAVWYWKGDQVLYSYWTLFLTFLTFIFFVQKHRKISLQIKQLNCLIKMNEKNLARKGNEWTKFKDDGGEYRKLDHSYTNDLDIFGPKSLFQWINTTNTFHGRNFLRLLLEEPSTDINEIKQRQKVVQELVENKEFCQNIQLQGMLATGIGLDPSSLVQYAQETKKFKSKWVRWSCFFITGLTIGSLAMLIANINIPHYIPLILIVVQSLITFVGYAKVSAILNAVHRFRANIKTYEKTIKIIEETKFNNQQLSEIREMLTINNISAATALKKLDWIIEAIDLRYNSISYIVFNFLFLWDYHCVFALEDWKEEYGAKIDKWFYAMGYLEGFSSLANIARLNPKWNYPTFAQEGLVFAAQGIGHPLIPAERRVCNDIDINNEICVITGSNMSGKTTMLRTIGINLVLAYTGAPVCAIFLKCSIVDIFTSMRVQDDLNSGISTFYAELLRIKIIIEHLNEKRPMIFLIDEIFRGTNSSDRITGAINVLRILNKPWSFGLISTHDLELCKLKDDNENITNYHFKEEYLEEEIHFDYKIRSGPCDTTNAKYLMKMVGIKVE